MSRIVPAETSGEVLDAGLYGLCAIANYYRISADPRELGRDLALLGHETTGAELVRAAGRIGLKARSIGLSGPKRLLTAPSPALLRLRGGGYALLVGSVAPGSLRLVDPVSHTSRDVTAEEAFSLSSGELILVARRIGGAGSAPRPFGLSWFLPSLWRYRKPLASVFVASLFIQVFALVTPLFFQVIVDKVLAHRSEASLYVLIGAIIGIGFFDAVLQYLRTYALAHTTSRIDVELGQRLFNHLMRLPLGYFESRPAGQTVARIRELENIRSFLTGQGLFSILDLIFAFVFIGVLFLYSTKLTLIVLASVPLYLLIAALVRPLLRDKVNEKFNRGAASQQFMVETVVGAHTVKAAAVEPIVQVQWEEKLAAYMRSAFDATLLAAGGQNAIQYISKVTTALVLLFGAQAVMDGSLTVGALVAFNMLAGQTMQPILRLSQVWQDFQQTKISVERLGDIFDTPVEFRPPPRGVQGRARGLMEFRNVVFRYREGLPDVLKRVNLIIRPGEVVGIVGHSGSGKSTLAKLIQRLYSPHEGQVLVDGADVSQLDPAWLRRNVGVVLQENLLFNRSIHDNIAFANPALTRDQVIHVAMLAGADEFIQKMPQGYDTMVEERGANLSGGQRQRIAIARALATDPPILIFDEATSALDYESERIIQKNMEMIVRNRTVIIIAHRLAAIRPCTRIVGMFDGRVIETGTHDELLKLPNGLYSRLWALQNDQVRA